MGWSHLKSVNRGRGLPKVEKSRFVRNNGQTEFTCEPWDPRHFRNEGTISGEGRLVALG
jgi:hypothetical protein